jgi:NAD(P)-dependent dehydrogenase (short-subunit alcohol dehydrogenase family)
MVTGPSSGIGRSVTNRLAGLGFHVVAAGRSPQRVGRVVAEVAATGGSAEPLIVDLASLRSVREAARAFEESGRSLDVLVNNAAVGAGRGTSLDGFELHFGVNHLGHFMLTHLLRRTFTPGARIVVVSSNAHYRAEGIDFERVTRGTRSMTGIAEYAVSKLANVLFTRELARRQPGWRTYAVHPGVVDTPIFPLVVRPFIKRGMLTPDQGADTIVWCAVEPGLAGSTGLYYHERAPLQPSGAALDDALAAELWARSERWCGVGPVGGGSLPSPQS